MRPRRTGQRGFILVFVIGMILLMTVLVMGFYTRTRLGLQHGAFILKSQQALNCARSGLQIAKVAVGRCNDTVKRLDDTLTLDMDRGRCKVDLQGEGGKINVNLLKGPGGQLQRPRIDQFLRLIDLINRQGGPGTPIGYGIVPAIIDWIDEDDLTTCLDFIQRENLGAESGHYLSLDPPYRSPNRPMRTIEDLLAVRGVTAQAYGRLRTYLTCQGEGLINLNTAPMPVIQSLSMEMDSGLAQAVINRRKIKAFETMDDLRQVPGMSEEILSVLRRSCTVGKDVYYYVTSRGEVSGVSRTVFGLIRKNPNAQIADVLQYGEEI